MMRESECRKGFEARSWNEDKWITNASIDPWINQQDIVRKRIPTAEKALRLRRGTWRNTTLASAFLCVFNLCASAVKKAL
jgi:hypothetical protein